MQKPTALEEPPAALPAAALEARKTESPDLHQTTMNPKNLPVAPHLTAPPLCPARPMETWGALPAWVPAPCPSALATPTPPARRSFRGWRHPAGPTWDQPTLPWLSLLPRLRRFWRRGSRRTVWLGPLLASCPPSTENPTLPSRQTCSEAQREWLGTRHYALIRQWASLCWKGRGHSQHWIHWCTLPSSHPALRNDVFTYQQ